MIIAWYEPPLSSLAATVGGGESVRAYIWAGKPCAWTATYGPVSITGYSPTRERAKADVAFMFALCADLGVPCVL